MIGWGRIGNKQTALYRMVVEPTVVDGKNWIVELPCNADIIEAVTSEFEDWEKTSNQALTFQNNNGWIKIESEADLPKESCDLFIIKNLSSFIFI